LDFLLAVNNVNTSELYLLVQSAASEMGSVFVE